MVSTRIPITTRGAEKLKAELDYLKKVARPNVVAAIAEAREKGDFPKTRSTMPPVKSRVTLKAASPSSKARFPPCRSSIRRASTPASASSSAPRSASTTRMTT